MLSLPACSSMQSARHEYLMRGQVVELSGKDAVVCVGSKDGAKTGQELNVYKVSVNTTSGPGKNPPRWQKVDVGAVRIAEVIDEHFAKAVVTRGEVAVNDVVELVR
jgi:hypothetical protein